MNKNKAAVKKKKIQIAVLAFITKKQQLRIAGVRNEAIPETFRIFLQIKNVAAPQVIRNQPL